jgi:hypothetical protein
MGSRFYFSLLFSLFAFFWGGLAFANSEPEPQTSSNKEWLGLDFDKPLFVEARLAKASVSLLEGEEISGGVITRMSADDSDYAYGLSVGMHYNEKLDLLIGYESLGSFEHALEYVDGSKALQIDADSALDYSALSMVARPKYELGKRFFVSADMGLAYVTLDRKTKFEALGSQSDSDLAALEVSLATGPEKDSELSLTYAISLSAKMGKNWQWRIFNQFFSIDEEDLATFGLAGARSF